MTSYNFTNIVSITYVSRDFSVAFWGFYQSPDWMINEIQLLWIQYLKWHLKLDTKLWMNRTHLQNAKESHVVLLYMWRYRKTAWKSHMQTRSCQFLTTVWKSHIQTRSCQFLTSFLNKLPLKNEELEKIKKLYRQWQ